MESLRMIKNRGGDTKAVTTFRDGESGMDTELIDTFGALRQLSRDVQEILLTHESELKQSALWNLGRWWCESEPRRPAVNRTVVSTQRLNVSGALNRGGHLVRR